MTTPRSCGALAGSKTSSDTALSVGEESAAAFLLESGSKRLLEDGSVMLLENDDEQTDRLDTRNEAGSPAPLEKGD